MNIDDIERYMLNVNSDVCADLAHALIELYNELLVDYNDYRECSENTIEGLQDQLKDLKDEIRTIIS
jgi:hypothetical protein